MMHICILRHSYFPDDPRDRKQAFALLEAGNKVDIVCLRKPGQDLVELVNGVHVFRIPLTHKRRSLLRYFFEYVASFVGMAVFVTVLYLRKGYDVIQVSTMPDFLVFATFIPKLSGAKVILDLHEPMPEVWLTKYGIERWQFFYSLQVIAEQLALKYADYSLTVTEALRRKVGERGANIKRIAVIPNVCEDVFHKTVQSVMPNNEDFRVVTHGLIEERYGHELVIRAIQSLADHIPELRYDVLGQGEFGPQLVRLAQRLGVSGKVRFWGFVPFEQLLERLSMADVGIIPMLRNPYSELIDTNKMYEYIALGKPVIVSKLSAVAENFNESQVMFFEPDSYQDLARCIKKLYGMPKLRKDLSKNASISLSKIRWEVTKNKYVGLFNQLNNRE